MAVSTNQPVPSSNASPDVLEVVLYALQVLFLITRADLATKNAVALQVETLVGLYTYVLWGSLASILVVQKSLQYSGGPSRSPSSALSSGNTGKSSLPKFRRKPVTVTTDISVSISVMERAESGVYELELKEAANWTPESKVKQQSQVSFAERGEEAP